MDVRGPSRIGLVVGGFVPPIAWYLFQQGLSVTLRAQCTVAGPPLGPLWGVGSILACGGAAWLAARTPAGGENVRFGKKAVQLAAGLFGLAIAFQTLATMIVPPCAR